MASLGIDLARNYSFFAIPAAFVLAITPHFQAINLLNQNKAPSHPGFENWNPPKARRTADEAKLSPAQLDQYYRCEAANENNFTHLPLFASAIVAGNLAKLSSRTLNTAALLYLTSRVFYNLIYIRAPKAVGGNGRTIAFLTGLITNMSMFVLAGIKLMDGPRVTY